MKMVQALLFWLTCVCAWTAAFAIPEPIPTYSQIQKDIDKAAELLQTHVISMKGQVPNLEDHRRHYAQIVYVIYDLAMSLSGCVHLPYFDLYQTAVNNSVPNAISDAQYVAEQVQFGINEFNRKTALVQRTVRQHCAINAERCDESVNIVIKSLLGSNKRQLPIYLAAGAAVSEFIENHNEFLSQSQNHSALKYVIDEGAKLEVLVFKLTDLLRILRPIYVPNDC